MKKIFFLLLTAFLFNLHVNAQIEKEPFMAKTFTDIVKNVQVETSGGSISVAGSESGGAKVEVFVSPNNGRDILISKKEIENRLAEDYEINITVSNNKLTATAKPKERNMDWKRSLNISFRIFVPKNITTDLSTSGGSISLKNLNGEQDFSTSGGSIHVENLSGKTKGRTSGGSIHVENSKDEIDLSTSGGSIHADKCTGNIKLSTSGGSLHLKSLDGTIKANTSGGTVRGEDISGDLETHTSGGNIKLKGLSCSIETSTSGGNIDVSIQELGKFVKIHNSGGNIDLRMPGDKGANLKLRGTRVNSGELRKFDGSVEKDRIDGTINGGGIPINVNAGNGRVSLSFN
jgi:hypothetical protein